MAINYFTANPDVAEAYQSNSYGLSPQEFADAHYTLYGAEEARAAPVVLDLVSQGNLNPTQIATATGIPVNQVIAQVATTVPLGQATLIGDTWVQPNYQVTGSGENQQIGGIESVSVYKTTGGVNDEVPVGTTIQNYSPTGEFTGTGVTKKTDSLLGEFLLGSLGLFGGAALAGFGGAGAAGTVGSTGLTMAELAQLDLALGGAGGTAGATSLASALTTGAGVGTLTNLTGGSGTGALTGGTVAGMGTGTGITTAGAGGLGGGTTVAGLGTGVGTGLTTTGAGLGVTGTGAGITAGTGLTGTGVLTGSGLGTTLLGTGVGTGLGTGILTGSGLGTTLTGVGTGVGTGLGTTLTGVGTGVGTGLGTTLGTAAGTGLGGLTAAQLAALFSGGLTTTSGLLQQQTSRDAAIAAQAMIDRETTAAKQAAQFRPIGMTTRFGTSEFVRDPITGQLTSAGYTLSPEAKAQQDRLNTLAGLGLTQAEGAQAQFAPLQTGAQSLFALGNKYLAETPEKVAENYLKSQMALLQPGRELELANLQNRLQQQGRGGLAVAQGGTLGATTPELQALYNARAQQEAQLAANAQQYGQQNVLFGAGLLGQGSQAMGQYYGGQQAAYAPYTTALGQVQGLEALGQQPLTMGAALGQQAAQAGANVGRLGLSGAEFSTRLATGNAATTNPYSTLLSGLGASPAFGQAIGGLFS